MNPEEMLTILKSLDEELENAESIHPEISAVVNA
jgi:hypothetical protein